MPYKNPVVKANYMRKYSREYMPIWRRKHPIAAARISARYEKSPKGRATRHGFVGIRNGRRRARIQKAGIGNPSLIAKIYARARELRQWFDVVVDHIIPLAKGGAHAASNLQIIYRLENLRKGARMDFIPLVIFS